MSEYQVIALLLAVIGPLLAVARILGAPESLLLFGAGLAAAFVPGLPPLHVDPQLVLNLFLPPVLYASTVRVSWHLLRFTWLPGVVLGAILALATIATVALAAHYVLLSGLSWTAAFLLGAVVAVFDTRLFHEAKGRPRVPRAVADTLKARELVGRIVILATFSLAVEAGRTGQLTTGAVLNHYVLDIPAGCLVGFIVGHGVAWARSRIDPAPVEIAVSIATPYAAALAAHALGLSVVGSVTTAALVVAAVRIDRHTGETISSSEARVTSTAFWEQASLILSSLLFFLAGHSLPRALGALDDWPAWQLGLGTVAILVLVLGVQLALGYAATWLQPMADALVAKPPGGKPRVAASWVMAWSSTRSVIGLVLALSIPAHLAGQELFAERDLVLVLAALTIVGSVLIQGLTLRAVVSRAGLADDEEDQREQEVARRTIGDAMATPGPQHRQGFDAARKALVRLRERDLIGDETLVRMLRETDLTARASESDALPGAGPPNP